LLTTSLHSVPKLRMSGPSWCITENCNLCSCYKHSGKIEKKQFLKLQWVKQLLAGLSSQSPGFVPGPVRVGLTTNRAVPVEVFLLVLRFCPCQDHSTNAAASCFNLLKPTGYVTHQQFNIQQLYALPTLYLCVLYLSENKQRLVPLTA